MNEPNKTGVWGRAFWSPPETKDRGDSDGTQIRTAVGSALSNWESVEEEVAELFIVLTECRGSLAVRRAFGAIESGGQRRNMLAAAAQVYFVDHPNRVEALKRIEKVLETIAWASRLRDNIAHGIVIDSITVQGPQRWLTFRQTSDKGVAMKGSGQDEIVYGAFLVPASYNTMRTILPQHQDAESPLGFLKTIYRYTSGDILEISYKFNALRHVIGDYYHSIKKPFKSEEVS